MNRAEPLRLPSAANVRKDAFHLLRMRRLLTSSPRHVDESTAMWILWHAEETKLGFVIPDGGTHDWALGQFGVWHWSAWAEGHHAHDARDTFLTSSKHDSTSGHSHSGTRLNS